ncbi:phosphate ABC transporter permease family protein, partial [Parvibaculum sp.]|uniref:phosphate ABC transporter permease family protein n=1 Tax=Parvibaculum sp. TaxID=2024848 RepID=UPI003C70D0E6
MAADKIALLLALFAVAGFGCGYWRALGRTRESETRFHSRPVYHGAFVMLVTVLPAFIMIAVWSAAAPSVIRSAVTADMPGDVQTQTPAELSLVMTTVESLATGMMKMSPEEYQSLLAGTTNASALFLQKGVIVGSNIEPFMIEAASRLNEYEAMSQLALTVVVLVMAALGFLYGRYQVRPRVRARNMVERITLLGLMAA